MPKIVLKPATNRVGLILFIDSGGAKRLPYVMWL